MIFEFKFIITKEMIEVVKMDLEFGFQITRYCKTICA